MGGGFVTPVYWLPRTSGSSLCNLVPRVFLRHTVITKLHEPRGGGGGTSLWVRRGCAPVLGSFWPENSGIGVSFYRKISVIGVYFHSEFSEIGVYCYTQILYKFSSNTWSVSGELISSIFVLKNVLRSEPRSNGHLEPKYSLPALNPLAL